MGAGLLLTPHGDALDRAFHVAPAYIPRGAGVPNAPAGDGAAPDQPDPYARSLQWSRRFVGLKVFLSLAVAGWAGYAAALRRQTAMGDLLREELAGAGWRVLNRSPLPVVCFVDAYAHGEAFVTAVARAVTRSGEAWLSTTRLGGTRPVLRACVTSHRTRPDDVRALVRALSVARAAVTERGYDG
jgi:glutamate/tyrosine decarboxylase-like PLP-dependent enzyme